MVRYSSNNNKKIYRIILASFVIGIFGFFGIIPMKTTSCSANGSSYIVMETSTGRVLKGENINAKLPMASTTKVLTALVVIENNNLSKVIKIPKEAVGVEGSSIYLTEGELISIEDLLYGLMLRSGNDSAVALAIDTAGSIKKFAELMNKKASDLGLKNSNFTNPHGLHDDNHFTSAYDLGLISCKAMENVTFSNIVSSRDAVIGETEKRHIHNKNKILAMYKGGNGVKTGFTKKAGRCLVAASKRDDMQVVSVVLNKGDMFNDCMNLMNYAHQNFVMTELINAKDSVIGLPVKLGKTDRAGLFCKNNFSFPLNKNGTEKPVISINTPNFITAPHKKENKVGSIEIKLNNDLLFSENLYTIENIEKIGVWHRIFGNSNVK